MAKTLKGPFWGFLASTWSDDTLKNARADLWQSSKTNSRGQIWVAEYAEEGLKPELVNDQLEIVDACLDAISVSEHFILVDNGSYGTRLSGSQHIAESSFLELELFQAILLSKPIYFLFVGDQMERSDRLCHVIDVPRLHA